MHWPTKLALSVVAGALALELGSFAYSLSESPSPSEDLAGYITDDILSDYVEFANRTPERIMVPHEELGWYRAPSSQGRVGPTRYVTDANGARFVPNASGPLMISTYGDSFTEGLEVDNAETWPARLSYGLGVRVQNYAVSGYGPDQALLRFEGHVRTDDITPIVVLAFIPENLNRLVNTFRPFYTYPGKDFIAFKPMFVETTPGAFEIRRFAPARLTAPALIRAARDASALDHWFAVLSKTPPPPRPSFPYFLALARSAHTASEGRPLLAPPSAHRIMSYLLARFYRHSKQFGFVPVVVALPGDPTDFRYGIKNLDDVVAELPPDLLFIDASRSGIRTTGTDYREMFGDTHYSVHANEEVARVVAARLRPYLDAPRPRISNPDRTQLLRIFDGTGTFMVLGAGWYPEEADATSRWRWSGGKPSVLEVFMPRSRPMRMIFRCRALNVPGNPASQRLEVVVNSRPVQQLEISKQEKSYSVEVPDSLVRAGENFIEFRHLWSASPKDLMSGSTETRALAVVWYELSLELH